tara:strand:+ start:712 stop:1404 length:693 start_codon:yes stop_codon:yes gene_type:complete
MTTKLKAANLNATYSADQVLKTSAAGALSWGEASVAAGFAAVTFYTNTSGDTWSKSTNNPTKIVVEVIGGAGGSGAGSGTGGSGGAGSYGIAYIDVSTVTTATVTVGAGGNGGSGSAGADGGISKFTYATGTGSFTEMYCAGGKGGGNANHTGGGDTALPTGPTNGIYIKGQSGAGAGYGGVTSHGYGASKIGNSDYHSAQGYGAAPTASNSSATGTNGNQGMVVVWEYK